MKNLVAALAAFAAVSVAHAAPVAAMTCVKKGSPTFAVIGISTGLFAPSTQSILEYKVTLGEFKSNGEVKSEKTYEQESNMKIFDDARQASTWVHANTVVIPLSGEKGTTGVVLVNLAQKKARIVDTDYETTEVLDCQEN